MSRYIPPSPIRFKSNRLTYCFNRPHDSSSVNVTLFIATLFQERVILFSKSNAMGLLSERRKDLLELIEGHEGVLWNVGRGHPLALLSDSSKQFWKIVSSAGSWTHVGWC